MKISIYKTNISRTVLSDLECWEEFTSLLQIHYYQRLHTSEIYTSTKLSMASLKIKDQNWYLWKLQLCIISHWFVLDALKWMFFNREVEYGLGKYQNDSAIWEFCKNSWVIVMNLPRLSPTGRFAYDDMFLLSFSNYNAPLTAHSVFRDTILRWEGFKIYFIKF